MTRAMRESLACRGKLCIHPRQTGPVREAFLPTPEEAEWARRVLNSGDGAAAVDGVMVEGA